MNVSCGYVCVDNVEKWCEGKIEIEVGSCELGGWIWRGFEVRLFVLGGIGC